MKILIAPDSFKESLSALEVARNIEKGIQRVIPETTCILVPMADGGEGTVQSLVDATEGKVIKANIHDPLMRKINSYYGMLGDEKTAIIEMASASGLALWLLMARLHPPKVAALSSPGACGMGATPTLPFTGDPSSCRRNQA